jgi:hypothetical protein
MIKEFVNEELLGERVEVALAAGAGPRLICIDSSANIFILNYEVFLNYVDVMNRYIRTVAAGGVLRVEALLDAGAAEQIRFCPEATASLISTNIICHAQWCLICSMDSCVVASSVKNLLTGALKHAFLY